MNSRVASGSSRIRCIERYSSRALAPGEVGAGRAEIGLEQRVVNKCGVTDDVGDGGSRMPGGEHHTHVGLADAEGIAGREQPIPLPAIGGETIAQVVDAFPQLLDVDDFLADGSWHATVCSQIDSCRQVVGVRMRIQDPSHAGLAIRDEPQDLVSRYGRGSRRFFVEIQKRIDDRAIA